MNCIVLVCLAVLLAFVEASSANEIFVKRTLQHHCYAVGDPHYKTFDNKYFNFMGHCRYVHVTDYCPKKDGGKSRLGHFKVIANTGNCARINVPSPVSCVNSVDVIIGGETVHLSYLSNSPAPKYRPEYTVTIEGAYVVVRTIPSGLTVKWNKVHGLWIYLDERFRGKVCGLCGNFDGNPNNDGVNGYPFRAGGKCGAPQTPQHPCEKKPHRRPVALKDCGVIKSHHFANCRSSGKDLERLYHDCVYDVCAETVATMKDSSCEAIKSASEECDGKLVSWGHLEKKCKCQVEAELGHGNHKRKECCHFPFKHHDRWYYVCIKNKHSLSSWCKTENGQFASCLL
ncbi:mucin-2 [Exaiptasia diaphana]|uniref:VWFD domain-containing protein n=1 Tax=Exaiptasia diaphana TaxID=2652724 RepID=A0A913YHY7_EXADI|nr:mucin-2 [Exaiptasia diaphana]